MTEAVLAIDAGNTRVKWGVHDGGKWNPCGALPTAEAPRLARQWEAIAGGVRAIASNVAGEKVERGLRDMCEARGWPIAFIASLPEQLGVTNGYRDHRQLGPDRWAGMICAHRTHAGHKLVVNAGTALTVDALTAGGRFMGGLIVPGPALMRASLDRGTAGLRLAEGHFEAFPAGTPDAITTGAIQACVGAIERMAAAMRDAGCAPDHVILSGGAAPEIAPHLPGGAILEENLVLEGLLAIARAS